MCKIQQIEWLEDMQKKLTLERQATAAWIGLLESYDAQVDLPGIWLYIVDKLCDLIFGLTIFYSA